MQRLNSFTWVSSSNDPFLRNLIVSTAVIAWAVRLKHGSLKSLFVVVSQFTQFNIVVTFHQARFFSLYPHPSGSIPPYIQGICVPTFSWFVNDGRQAGKDVRFDPVRNNKFKFFTFWHIQGLWVFITTMPVHVSNFCRQISRGEPPAWNALDSVGLVIWAVGLFVEVIADQQKSTFRKQQHGSKQQKWICSGLWA
jgi:steroid 5-alpha reductase family enzyme